MSWLSRLTPRGLESRANQNTSPSGPVIADPETCLMVFQNHWRQVSRVLERQDYGGSSVSDDIATVQNHMDQMMCLLAAEQPVEGEAILGPILDLVLKENILERLLQWHLRCDLSPHSLGVLLKLFEVLIGQSRQLLLQHRGVLQPLLRLLAACGDSELGCSPALEGGLVLLLNQVCVCLAQQPAMLDLLLCPAPGSQGSAPHRPSPQVIFSLLVPFIHREGSTGQQARDALLLVMATSASNQAAARYITESSYFCQVLAAGLCALYSSLPRKLEVRDDDWHALRQEDWVGVASLARFMNSLEFCNAVVQVSHPIVGHQLLDFIHTGFLEPVMAPALHKSSVEEMIASTAYLDLFLRSVTESDLLKTFLRFILLDRHDNDSILDTLLTRISSNSRLCMVSLSLFQTLLSLNCEDLMLHLILRYLLPCTHVMVSQRPAVRETDMYGKSAAKFLSLIPECCRLDTVPPGDQEDEGKERPSMESTVPPKPRTQSRLAMLIRQQGNGPNRAPARPRGDSTPPILESIPEIHRDVEREVGYLAYLRDARMGIELCNWGCRDWSAPYDGVNPPPNSVPTPPPPPTAMPTLIMVPEHFSLHPVAVRPPAPAIPPSGPPPTTTPDSSQQEAVAIGSECSGSEQDDGEWGITISKKGISLTLHTNKRSLQQLEPVAALPPVSDPEIPLPSASTPQSATTNGVGPGGVASPCQVEEMKVKKLKTEQSDGSPSSDWGQNRAMGCSPESCQAAGSGPSQDTASQSPASLVQQISSSQDLEPSLSQSSILTPDSTSDPSQSSIPTNDSISDPSQSSIPTNDSISDPSQSSIPTNDSISDPSQSSIPTQDSISDPSQSSTDTLGSVPTPSQSSTCTADSGPDLCQSSIHTPHAIPETSLSSINTPNSFSDTSVTCIRPPDKVSDPSQSSVDISDPVRDPSQSSIHTPDSVVDPSQRSDTIPDTSKDTTHITDQVPAPQTNTKPLWAAAMSQGLDSVDSLIKEVLEQTPVAPLGKDSGGQGISIEAFHRELQELENRVCQLKEPSQVSAPLPVVSAEQEESMPPIAVEPEPKSEGPAKEVYNPASSLGPPAGQPYTGPFVAVLFAKLECMLQNSLYVNILLTGILSRLACYPQPLLRSFLLNTNMVFQPSVKSLVQVLGSVKTRIEAFAATQENFADMLGRARQYLVARGKLDWTDPLGLSVPKLRRSDSLVKSRRPSLGELILRHTQSPVKARLGAQQALSPGRGGAVGLERQAEALRVKNAVYSAVVFSEFLKELAALAQEHAVAIPFPPSQGAEE
ncbi:hypothetical protein GJAV_G00207740 [Gymnothorax javanicus]|nr:hypothetical protein GJAV_G00207740 [Gymnothorax javanicus]